MNWSKLTVNQVADVLKTDIVIGINGQLAKERHKKTHQLDEPSGLMRVIKIIFHQFTSPLVYLLIISALISLSIQRPHDAYFIFIVIVANATFGFFQEYKSDNALRALKKIVPDNTYVIRNSKMVEIHVSDLVVGDVVVLQEGKKVPADIRVSQSFDMEVDESMLTGESMPVAKKPDAINLPGNNSVVQSNMVFYGSKITHGHGRGIVIGVGRDVRFAGTLAKARQTTEIDSPLEKEVARLAKILLAIAAIFAVLTLIVFLTKGAELKSSLVYVVNLFVAIIPEGLPIVVTLTLAIAALRLSRNKVVTRRLSAADVLGNVDLVLTDKTGTITTGKMTARKIWAGGEYYEIVGSKNHSKIIGKNVKDAFEIARVGALANSANIAYGLKGIKKTGDSIDIALLALAHRLGITSKINKWEKIGEVPFSSRQKYMAVTAKNKDTKEMFVKGAPEKILNKSSKIIINTVEKRIVQAHRDIFNSTYKKMASDGFRVIAIAKKQFESGSINHKEIMGLTLLGIIGIEDAPRDDIKPTIVELKSAGIDIKLVTGDHSSTAYSIAREVGITDKKDFVITGKKLSGLLAARRHDVLKNARVFARMSPEDKLDLVKYYRKQGLRVAMAGDGINDAAAIKAADVGIALAGEGGEVAQQTADVVLLDNNFNVLASSLREGKTVWQNLRKVLFFLLSTNLAEFAVIFLAILLAVPSPFTAIQILWINIITDTVADEALALEPPEKGIIKNRNKHLFSNFLVRRIIVSGLWQIAMVITMYVWAMSKFSQTQAMSIAYFTLVSLQVFNLFNARSLHRSVFASGQKRNYWIYCAALLTVILLFASVYYLPLSSFLGLEKIDPKIALSILLISVSIIGVVEIDKIIASVAEARNERKR